MRARLLLFAVGLCTLPLFAQTYTPKTLRLQGADGMDQAEVMRLLELSPGQPVTRAEINAAMQRLGDSGLFTEVRYTVDANALVVIVKLAPGSQPLPVRFSNFVWWKPGELEPLVEARVPQFHGKLTLTGPLTDQVEAALAGLLEDKGISGAHVTARLSAPGPAGSASNTDAAAIALTVEQPQLTLGKIQVTGIAPGLGRLIEAALAHLTSDEFDTLITPGSIVASVTEMHRNAGYLDVSVKAPFFSEPYKQTVGYALDASVMVYPGALYRISVIRFDGIPSPLQLEVAKASGINVGDAAGARSLRLAQAATARVIEDHGWLEATANAVIQKDGSAHTVTYRITVVPGAMYTFAGVNIGALSPAQQALFLHAFHMKPGVVADLTLRSEMLRALEAAGASLTHVEGTRNVAKHTITYVLSTRPSDAAPGAQ